MASTNNTNERIVSLKLFYCTTCFILNYISPSFVSFFSFQFVPSTTASSSSILLAYDTERVRVELICHVLSKWCSSSTRYRSKMPIPRRVPSNGHSKMPAQFVPSYGHSMPMPRVPSTRSALRSLHSLPRNHSSTMLGRATLQSGTAIRRCRRCSAFVRTAVRYIRTAFCCRGTTTSSIRPKRRHVFYYSCCCVTTSTRPERRCFLYTRNRQIGTTLTVHNAIVNI